MTANREAVTTRGAVYEIFVDRFAGPGGGVLRPAPDQAPPWQHHCGGTLDGVTARLEHIRSLGADAVYLTPVFPAPSNHKYDASSYDHVEPRFGGDEAFDRLAEQCRERGMGLILDGVFNHVGAEHQWFLEAQAGNGHSGRRGHFKWALDGEADDYACWRGYSSLPELELASPDVQEALFDAEEAVIRRWLRRGATGWRLDCANDLGLSHCARATRAAHCESPADGVVGEVMTYAEEWLQDGCLDGIMNYYFRETVLGLVTGEVPVVQAACNFKLMARRYPPAGLLRSWNILSSHDTPRLATLVPDVARRRMAQVLAFAYPGVPMIYYGEEIGMEGGHDPDCRRPMIWDEGRWHQPTLTLVRRLTSLRSTCPALRSGEYLPMPQPGVPSILTFARTTTNPSDVVVVVANASDERYSGKLFTPYSHLFDGLILRDLLEAEENVRGSAGSIHVSLPPWSIAFYTPDDSNPRYSFFRS